MKPAPRLRIPQMRRISYGGSIGTDCCDIFTEYRGTSNLHDETYIRGFGYAPRAGVWSQLIWPDGPVVA